MNVQNFLEAKITFSNNQLENRVQNRLKNDKINTNVERIVIFQISQKITQIKTDEGNILEFKQENGIVVIRKPKLNLNDHWKLNLSYI